MGRSLNDYENKRDFGKTPEPVPGRRSRGDGDPVFVVHRHAARRLHYDLRLEMDGVLKSWAVPKGFSYDPQDKRLAVRTEDHPLEYESFAGVIPQGEYGAGTLDIWDRGRYRIVSPGGSQGVAEGKLEIVLAGRRLRGEWHLVRMKGKPGEDPWLLFKARDYLARSGVASQPGPDLAAAKESPFPRTRQRMTSGGEREVWSDSRWVFEIEFEGRRALLLKQGAKLRWSGPGLPRRPAPAIAKALQGLRATDAVLDGVLVATDEFGRPSRDRLDDVLRSDEGGSLCFYSFDLLHYEGLDIRPVPLVDRKAALKILIPERSAILFVDHVAARGEAMVAAAAQAGFHGVVAKQADSSYTPGPSLQWQRIPIVPSLDARRRSLEETLPAGAPARNPRVKFTNLEKVFFPETGVTKGDLIGYYAEVAEFLLPYLQDRPVHLRRCPDGIHGECFYQRRAPEPSPAWLDTTQIRGSDGELTRHLVCNHTDALLHLVNLGSIDFHPWLSRVSSLESPDVAVFDLDPKEAPFLHVIKVARVIGRVLRSLGIEPSLKTSGASGLHLFVPLRAGYSYEQVRMFCEGIALQTTREVPALATIERSPSRRGGRVYVDFLQNARGQTVVPPYVVRPVPAASVSTPLGWEELEDTLQPSQHTLRNVPERLARQSDLFRSTLEEGYDLVAAATALQDLLG